MVCEWERNESNDKLWVINKNNVTKILFYYCKLNKMIWIRNKLVVNKLNNIENGFGLI